MVGIVYYVVGRGSCVLCYELLVLCVWVFSGVGVYLGNWYFVMDGWW